MFFGHYRYIKIRSTEWQKKPRELIFQCYPAGVFYDLWFKLPSNLENLPTPGFESHWPLGGCQKLCWPPNRGVQAMDGDVLHCLWAQQMQEVQLDTASTEGRLLREAGQVLLTWANLFKSASGRLFLCINTLDAVTGLRQVCPPPVKLQETSMVSDEQPRLGSIQ